MKKIKRILAAMLCLCMALSMLPVGASATGAEDEAIADLANLEGGGYANTDVLLLSANVPSGMTLIHKTDGLEVLTPEGYWFAYDMGTLQAGYYDGVFSWLQYSGGSSFDFYVVQKGDVAAINAALESGIKPFTTLNGKASSKTTATKPTDAVYLPQDGEYMLVGRYSSGDPYSAGGSAYAIYLKEFKMKKVSDVAFDKASIDFTGADAFAENTANGTWLRSRADDGYVTFAHGNKVQNGQDMRHVYFWTRYDTGFMAFDLGTIADGDYKGKITYATTNNANLGGEYNFYLVRVNEYITGNATCGGNVLNDINITLNAPNTYSWEVNETHLLKTINFLTSSGTYWNTAEFEAEDVSAGRYYLVAIPTSGNAQKYGYLQGFEMVPADYKNATAGAEADAAGAALFGENYAYVRHNGDAWVVSFFGGIKETEGYTEVGFEVNDTKYGDGKVYSTLSIGGQTIDNADFGAGVGYIFTEEVELAGAPDSVTFRAYAKDADGNYVYGNTYTAVIE